MAYLNGLFFCFGISFWCSKRGDVTVMYPSWVGDDLVVKFGNCYVRVLLSTCRQIDARLRQTTQDSLFDTPLPTSKFTSYAV